MGVSAAIDQYDSQDDSEKNESIQCLSCLKKIDKELNDFIILECKCIFHKTCLFDELKVLIGSESKPYCPLKQYKICQDPKDHITEENILNLNLAMKQHFGIVSTKDI